MKFCGQCKTDKSEDEFNKNKSRKDGLNTMCRDCSNKNSRKYYQENTDYHKKYIVQQNRRRRTENRQLVNQLKEVGCRFCPEKEVCCLDFHHIENKDMEISVMIRAGYSEESILKEIDKCILVCANCHRKIHAGVMACPTD